MLSCEMDLGPLKITSDQGYTTIEHFDEEMEDDEEDPDEENRILSECWIGDGIEQRCEAYYIAEGRVPHTFEEKKEEYIREGQWEKYLAEKGMTEEEYRAYHNKRYGQGDAAQDVMPNHHIKGEPDRLPLPRPEDRQRWSDTATGCNYSFK